MQTLPDGADRPYHHGDLRRAIVEAAMEMLREGGGARITMREVARRAGVSHAAPYKHFPDKAALLAEVALIGFGRLREVLLAAAGEAGGDLRRALLTVAHAYLGFAGANPALYRLMFGSEAGASPEIHLDARALAALEVVTDLLEQGQAAGLIRRRPLKGQAAACWAQLHGLAMLGLDGLLLPHKVGEGAVDAALATLLEGLACGE